MPLYILVINENEALCDFISLLLTEDGHKVCCVQGAGEALQAVRNDGPDLVVLEVSRADIGALEIVDRLQRNAESRHIPVIVISDYPDLEYELLNLFDFIPKPVDKVRLREDVATIAQGGKKRAFPPQPEPLTSGDYLLFYEYLLSRSGLHFERRNVKILERGLLKRMTALKIASYREYYDYLLRHQESRQELKKLLPFLTIGETYFFRYHAHFTALRKLLLTEFSMADNGGRLKLRLWSAGCSTGEEPYSMAMTIMEAIPGWQELDIKILATDIDNRALKRAQDGVYGPWAMRAIQKTYLDRYFDKIGKGFRIKDEVKRLVDFSHLNLQGAELPSADGEFSALDVIFCRNVTIYFTLATTREIIEKFSACLKPGGHLFLGHSETLAQISSRFDRLSMEGGFFYRKKDTRSAATESMPVRHKSPAPMPAEVRPHRPKPPVSGKPATPDRTPAPETDKGVAEHYREAQELFAAEHFPQAATMLKDIIRRQPDHAGAMVSLAFILANNGHYQEALATCGKALVINDLMAEAYFLKGLILEMTDDLGEAAEEYRKAILLEMDFVMPHYQLSRLYSRLGRKKEALRELKNTLKTVAKHGINEIVPYSGGLSSQAFAEQLKSELAQVE